MGKGMMNKNIKDFDFRTGFNGYRDDFEIAIIEKGIEVGVFDTRGHVSVNRSKMAYTAFAKRLGAAIKTYKIFAVDYYGYIKKSTGFIDSLHMQIGILRGKQIKSMRVPLVHFASIKMEDVAKINSNMLKEFPKFKQTILTLRGFKE